MNEITLGTLHVQETEGDASEDVLEAIVAKTSASIPVGETYSVTPLSIPGAGATLYSLQGAGQDGEVDVQETTGDVDEDHVKLVVSEGAIPGLQVGEEYETISIGAALIVVVPDPDLDPDPEEEEVEEEEEEEAPPPTP